MFKVTTIGSKAPSTPDEPFIRSLLDGAPFYRYHTLCPIPGVRMIAFLPITTAAEYPPGQPIRIPVVQVVAFHGGIIRQQSATDQLTDFLSGAYVNRRLRAYGPIERLSEAWHAPSLALPLNPVWRPATTPGPPFTPKRFCGPIKRS
ncbi:hypothetical protein ABGB16_16340 [Micromonospora sp. B11E3]|uniref:hypothetical protein n=1 Tax=Micromonospora sp. B11E3 TaxID=3153562 RepID=UPI00325F0BEC